MNDETKAGQADEGWDNYQERVTRNEGRLIGLEHLVAETRESDKKLIEQRSESLAQELERRTGAMLELVAARAAAVLALSQEERRSDRQHNQLVTEEAEKRGQMALTLLREVYDTAIAENYKQSREAIAALEARSEGRDQKIEQMVRQWRDSDREARDLFATELAHHLDALNHNNERMRDFQANSVTRELWQSEKDASIARENLLREQLVAMDKSILTMNPQANADKTHNEILGRMEKSIGASSEVLNNKIATVSEKVAELKTYVDTTSGRSSGYQALYGWGIAGITVIIAIIVMANAFVAK